MLPLLKVPPPNVQNQNANPNAGAGAVKRPSDAPMGGGQSKAPTPSAPRSSVLQARPAAAGGAAPLVTPIAMITPYQERRGEVWCDQSLTLPPPEQMDHQGSSYQQGRRQDLVSRNIYVLV